MCSYLNSVNSVHVLLTIGMSPSSVQIHEWFFMFLCLPIWPVFKKKRLLIMEISNIFNSKADRMVISPRMPVTLLQQLGSWFSLFLFALLLCVCVCAYILGVCVCVCVYTDV